ERLADIPLLRPRRLADQYHPRPHLRPCRDRRRLDARTDAASADSPQMRIESFPIGIHAIGAAGVPLRQLPREERGAEAARPPPAPTMERPARTLPLRARRGTRCDPSHTPACRHAGRGAAE